MEVSVLVKELFRYVLNKQANLIKIELLGFGFVLFELGTAQCIFFSLRNASQCT